MQRDILLLTEMIDAAEQAQQLTAGITVSQLETDRQRFTSTEVVYGVTGTDVTVLPEYGVSP